MNESKDNESNTRIVEFCKRKSSTPHVSPTPSQSPPHTSQTPHPPPPQPKNKRKKADGPSKDIYEIHNKIITLFDEEFNQLSELKGTVTKLEWIVNNSDNQVEQKIANNKLKELITTIKLVESGHREARYINRTEKILREYTELINQPIKVDFMGNKISDQYDRKQNIIREFFNIAKDYIQVQPIESQRRSMLCPDCRIELQLEDDFLFLCPTCGYTVKHFASIATYQENNRINVAQRYVYDKRAHFGDSIKKFQAKQNTTISDQVYQDLWEKVSSHDIPIDRLTKDHIYEFLKLTGHSDHYEDITLIYCEMTGKQAPNISHLENKLFALFDAVDPIYERVKPQGRVNFLNGQFVLFKLLQKLKYPCREEDFYILKTREKMLEHDQIWKKICHELSWTYIATV